MTGPVTTEALVEKLARDLAREGGWNDPDAPWTENQVIIARGGAGEPVWRDFVDNARSLLGRETFTTLLAALQQVTAERDEARAKIDAARVVAEGWPVLKGQETLAGKIMTLAAAARQAPLGERGTQFVLQHLMRALDAADATTSELAQLRAEGEAKDRRIAALEGALAPFAKAGELFGPRLSDDYDQSIYAPAAGPEFAISADHLRAAHAATAREG